MGPEERLLLVAQEDQISLGKLGRLVLSLAKSVDAGRLRTAVTTTNDRAGDIERRGEVPPGQPAKRRRADDDQGEHRRAECRHGEVVGPAIPRVSTGRPDRQRGRDTRIEGKEDVQGLATVGAVA